MADRVNLETGLPPVVGKEYWPEVGFTRMVQSSLHIVGAIF